MWYRFLKSEENEDEAVYEYSYEKHEPTGILVFNKDDEEIWFLKLADGDDGTQIYRFGGAFKREMKEKNFPDKVVLAFG